MANITRIDVRVVTGKRGIDKYVYIGVAGREFNIDSQGDDFRPNSDRTYTFGTGSNVKASKYNDPGSPQLDTDDLDKYPVYVRITSSGWELKNIVVKVNPGPNEIEFDNDRLAGTSNSIRLANGSGKTLYLSRS